MFRALDILRALRDDKQLTTSEFAVLVAAVLRTGDRRDLTKHNQVCADQATLAEDAKVSLATIKRIYRSKEFRKYFDFTDEYHHGRRWVILRWVPGVMPGVTPGVTMTPHLNTYIPALHEPCMEDYPVVEDYNNALRLWAEQRARLAN